MIDVSSAAPKIKTRETTATPTMTAMPYATVNSVVTPHTTKTAYVQVLGYVTETKKTVEAETLNFNSAATRKGPWGVIIAALALVIF